MLVRKKSVISKAYEADVEITKPVKSNGAIRNINTKSAKEILKTMSLDNPKDECHRKLRDLVTEFIDIFKDPEQKLSCTSQVVHRIITEDVPPILKRPYRVPYHRQEVMKQEVKKLLDDGIIMESQSPWSFPAILIEKKRHPGEDAQFRLVIDYRGLNDISKTDYFPLPNIQETIDKLSGASIFSTMDLASGYFQVPLHPDDQEKTAFSTPDNHYHFLRMAMGLKNAPATWSRMMNHILGKLTYTECLVYLDDIIVFSSDVDTHLERLRHIFEKIRESNLKFKPTKCHFLKEEIEYLGHVIRKGGYTTDPKKTEIIKSYPVPRNVREIRAFLGLCGFYRKFVSDFAKISQPLTHLTKKNVKYHWDMEQQNAFDTLKQALISPPVLRYPDLTKQFILNTDASGTSIAAILTQTHNEVEHPISYSSRTLNEAERRYSTIERECLAIVYAVKTYRNYLTGTHFTIMTDHRPLKYLLTIKDASSRLAKWAMYLMEYSFTIQYRKGKLNSNVDSLTRLRTGEDVLVENIIAMVQEGQGREEVMPMPSVIWSKEELKTLQQEDDDIKNILSKNLTEEDLYYINQDSLLTKRRRPHQRNDPIFAPKHIVPEIIRIYHNSIYACHPGQKKTLENIEKDFYWHKIKKDVKTYVEQCHSCNVRKTNYQPPVEMQDTNVPYVPWGRISLDIVGPLNKTDNNNKYIQTCVDFLTRYPECIPLQDIRAETVAKAFVENIICRFGTPRELLTDNGSQFVGKLYVEVCRLLGIKKLKTTPYHPSANGIIERMHRSLKTMISHFVSDHYSNWDEVLPYCLMAYRNLPHEATKDSPFFLMFGRDMELPLHLTIKQPQVKYDIDENYASEMLAKMQVAHEIAKTNIEKSIHARCDKHNAKKLRKEFQLGDLVYLYTPAVPGKRIMARKFYSKWSGPYRIIEKRGPVTFKIKEVNGKKEHMVHADRLKPCKGYLPEKTLKDSQDENEEDTEVIDDETKQDEIDDFINQGAEIPEFQEENQDESESEDSEATEFWTDSDSAGSDEPQEIPIDIGRRTRTREVRLPEKYKDFVL